MSLDFKNESNEEIMRLRQRNDELERALSVHSRMEADALCKQDEKIRSVTNAIPAIVYTYQLRPDGTHNLTFVSQAIRTIFGLSPEDVLEDFSRLWNMILPEDADCVYASIQDSAKTQTPWRNDYRIKMKDGTIKWIHGESIPEKRRDDGIVIWNGALIDITDRKKAEVELADSENRFKKLFEEAWDGILLADAETKRFAMCNRMICTMLGYSQEELMELGVKDLHPQEDLAFVESKFRELLKATNGVAADIPVLRKDGSVFYVDITTTLILLGGKQFLMGTFHDMTARKQISDSLKASGDYLNRIINLIADPVFVKDREHRWVLLNDAYCQFMGYPREQLIGKNDYDYFPKSEADVFWEKDEYVFNQGKENVNEEDFTDSKGFTHTIVTKKTLYFDQSGRKLIVGIIRDVTEVRRTQEQLRETSQFLNSMIENIPNMVFVKDAQDLRFVRLNRAGIELLGIPQQELVGKNDYDFFPKEQADFFVKKDREAMTLGDTEDISRETIRTRNKGERVLHTKKVTIRDVKGNPQYLMGISEDITEREKAEAALKKSADEVSDLYNNSPCGYHSLDENGVYLRINDTELRWLGYSREEIVGKKRFSDLATAESTVYFEKQFPVFKKQGWIAGVEFDMVRRDGSILPILLSATAIKAPDGRFIMSRSTMIDMTERKLIEAELKKYQGNLENLVKKRTLELEQEIVERKKTEELLRLSESRYQIVTERTGQLIYDCDLRSGRFEWAGAIEEITGFTSFEFRNVDTQRWLDLIHPEDRAPALLILDDSRIEAGSYFVVYRLQKKHEHAQDSYIYIEDRGVFLRDENGHVDRRLGSMKDVTERKRAELALRESEAQYRALIETTGTGFVVVNAEGKVLAANQEYVRLSGHDKLIEIYGRSVLEWTAENEKKRNQEAVEKCVRDGFLRNFEIDYVDSDGKITPVEINATIVETAGVRRILTLCRDITERKNREEVKAELISMVSHELRTPLVPIREGICILLEGLTGPINDEQKDILCSSKANIDRLTSLVNNFLDFQKIEAGIVHLRMERINLNALARQAFVEGSQLTQSRNLGFELELDESLPDVECDPTMMMRVVINLLHNAVRFTRKGKVTIKTSRQAASVKFSVSDTGIGIRTEDIPHLFRKFNQLADGKDLIQGGTGLGLAISKKIIEQHHGTIGVESKFGKGSVFSFVLNAV